MKTITKILSILFGILVISGTIFILSELQADTVPATSVLPNTNYELPGPVTPLSGITYAKVPEKAGSILDDSMFWVNYLKTTVVPELDSMSTENEDTFSVINDMEHNPTYWVDYLKQMETTENDFSVQ